MKILVVGGTGTIGRILVTKLKEDHQVIVAGRSSGDVQFNMEDAVSMLAMFNQVGKLDAIVCTAGEAKWDYFSQLSEDDFYIGIKSKLMGQVNLVRLGKDFLNPGGSITLSTGILADDPVAMTSSAAMVNGAIHSFVKAVVLELGNIRVNAVSSGLVIDAYDKYKDYFPGHDPVPMAKVVNGFLKSIIGKVNGQIIRVNA